MKRWLTSLSLVVLLFAPADASQPFHWRALRTGLLTVKETKKLLGEPLHEYREQLIYEKQLLDPGDPNLPPIPLSTVVFNIGVKGGIESIFLFPEYGTTDEQLRPLFGKGQKMSYRKFLASMGEIKVGAGTRPDEKLHYVDLDSPAEVFPQPRILIVYGQQDVVTGGYLVKLVIFY